MINEIIDYEGFLYSTQNSHIKLDEAFVFAILTPVISIYSMRGKNITNKFYGMLCGWVYLCLADAPSHNDTSRKQIVYFENTNFQ